jgi:hypothetical protein
MLGGFELLTLLLCLSRILTCNLLKETGLNFGSKYYISNINQKILVPIPLPYFLKRISKQENNSLPIEKFIIF